MEMIESLPDSSKFSSRNDNVTVCHSEELTKAVTYLQAAMLPAPICLHVTTPL